MLLTLLACLPTGTINDDTGPGMVGDGACLWICSEDFPYWETDYQPTAESECYDVAVDVCGADPYGVRWLDEPYPEESCCVVACGGGVSTGTTETTDECDTWATEGCDAPRFVAYSCDAY